MVVFLLSIFSLKSPRSSVDRSHWLTLVVPMIYHSFFFYRPDWSPLTGLTVRGRGKGDDDEARNVTGTRGRYCRSLHGDDGRRRRCSRRRRRRRRRLRRTLASPYVCVTRCARGVA